MLETLEKFHCTRWPLLPFFSKRPVNSLLYLFCKVRIHLAQWNRSSLHMVKQPGSWGVGLKRQIPGKQFIDYYAESIDIDTMIQFSGVALFRGEILQCSKDYSCLCDRSDQRGL